MAVEVMRMIASVGSSILGIGNGLDPNVPLCRAT